MTDGNKRKRERSKGEIVLRGGAKIEGETDKGGSSVE